ncbi:MAG: hypothetical protein EPN88_16345, partial [Bacteroidetes bacterium]
MKNNLLFGVITVITLVFSSCTKDGATGPAGANGTNGNANVVSSVTVPLNNWITGIDDGIKYSYEDSISWTGITQAIKDKGFVMIYTREAGDIEWVALPYSSADTSSSFAFNYLIEVGAVEIEYSGYDHTGSPGTSSMNNWGLEARIVAISAS